MIKIFRSLHSIFSSRDIHSSIQRLVEGILNKTYDVPRRKFSVENGVAVRRIPLLESQDVLPDVEAELVKAIREHVETGEETIIIGGGRGVSTVWMSRQVGSKGSVLVYEPGSWSFEMVQTTIRVNNVGQRTN